MATAAAIKDEPVSHSGMKVISVVDDEAKKRLHDVYKRLTDENLLKRCPLGKT